MARWVDSVVTSLYQVLWARAQVLKASTHLHLSRVLVQCKVSYNLSRIKLCMHRLHQMQIRKSTSTQATLNSINRTFRTPIIFKLFTRNMQTNFQPRHPSALPDRDQDPGLKVRFTQLIRSHHNQFKFQCTTSQSAPAIKLQFKTPSSPTRSRSQSHSSRIWVTIGEVSL